MGSMGPQHDDSQMSFQEIIDLKRHLRNVAVASYLQPVNSDIEHGCVTERQQKNNILDIDDLDVLQGNIASGRWSSLEVTIAYIVRASLIHQHTNCLTEVLFDEAVQRARELDTILRTTGKCVGPLHGIPITLKDQFNVKGYDTTLGYVGRSFSPASGDAVLVTLLKRLGAIVMAKTNLPQSIMWCETENPLWGLTVNSRNPDLTPGGSTGGEAVLLEGHGSICGWGTDIGGSIRIPSHMNGLYGLKPTSTRLSYRGVPVSTEGQEHVPSSTGPLTRSLSSLTTIMKAVINAEPWNLDPRCTPIPWRDDQYLEPQTRRLTIGIMFDDGVVKVHPPIERLLKEVSTKLAAAGHELVTWDPSGHEECIAIMDQYYTADGGEDIRRDVLRKGEPFIPHVETLLSKGNAISVYDYWQLNKQKFAAQERYNDKWSSMIGPSSGRMVDVLLTPTMPHAAVPHRTCRWVGYTKIWNFLDYPALSFPAGAVSKEVDVRTSYEPRNDLDAWNWKLYDPELMDGHHVGLQLVTRRFQEEKLLGIAKVVQDVISNPS